MDEQIQQIIGHNVLAARTRAGINKTDFCLMADISRPYLNKIEAGKANVTIGQLGRLASSLGMNLTDLLHGEGDAATAAK